MATITVFNNGNLNASASFNDALVSGFGDLTYAERLKGVFDAFRLYDQASYNSLASNGLIDIFQSGNTTTLVLVGYTIEMTGILNQNGSQLSQYKITDASGGSVLFVGNLLYDGLPLLSTLLPGSSLSALAAADGSSIAYLKLSATLGNDFSTLSGTLTQVTSATLVSASAGGAGKFFGAEVNGSISVSYNISSGNASISGNVTSQTVGVATTSIAQIISSGTYNLTDFIGITGINASVNTKTSSVNFFSGNDVVNMSGAVGSIFDAGSGSDSINGSSNNDTIFAGPGNDSIAAGAGFDRVVFSNVLPSTFSYNQATDTFTFSTPLDGTDSISGVEVFQFADRTITKTELLTDNTPPTITITSNRANLIAGQTATITFTLSEASSNFTDSDISVSGGVLSPLAGSGLSYTAIFTPTPNSTTSGVISVASGAFSDTAGNNNTTGASRSISVNTLPAATSGNDNLVGSANGDSINGLAGNDTIDGLAGDDTLTGGTGVDRFVVSSGVDTITDLGNGGADTLAVTSGATANVTIAAAWSATAATNNFGTANITTAARAVNLAAVNNGSAGFSVTNVGAATTLTGSSLDDVLNGGTGHDRLSGGSGNDLLKGNAGNDSMTGGLGADTFVLSGNDTVVDFNSAQSDTVNLGAVGNGSAVIFTTVAGLLDLSATATNARFRATAAATGATIVGASGADSFTGGNAADRFSGGAGNDTLNGGNGSDTLTGGAGADSLVGGAGSDVFVFAAGDSNQATGFDIISAFAKGAVGTGDLIDFSVGLTQGGNANPATVDQASINQTTGIATFAVNQGRTLADALSDVANRLGADGDAAGEFAFFRVNNRGNFHLFISDGSTGAGPEDVVVQLIGVTSITSINLSSGNLTITA